MLTVSSTSTSRSKAPLQLACCWSVRWARSGGAVGSGRRAASTSSTVEDFYLAEDEASSSTQAAASELSA
ncbi:hypothetical protein PF003_g34098 [Phytophthora fragariae]|nr:hypothetical protein PF003_g34098 [Phytophthora fragariae]